MPVGALLTGIGALSQAVSYGIGAFGGDPKLQRTLMIAGQAARGLGGAVDQFSNLGAGSAGKGVGLKIQEGRNAVSEAAGKPGGIMARMINEGKGDLLGKPSALDPIKNFTTSTDSLKDILPGGNPFEQQENDGSSMELFLKPLDVNYL
tara:strand:- start:517 stop:963 length:447 start_codon:yes stop_codon:yes gene_type:complete